MELEFMELEFHKKRHYKYLKCHYRVLKNCIELEFMELEFQQIFF